MEITAKARYVKTAPRKIRSVCDLLRGKKLTEALSQLSFLKKQAASDLLSLLKSAEANAKQKDQKPENLYIKEISCDQGPVLKRYLLRARGRITPIKKKMSHITVVLSDERKSQIPSTKSETKSNVQSSKSKKV